jgi:hypothetical protein
MVDGHGVESVGAAFDLAAIAGLGLPPVLAELAAPRVDEMDVDTVNRELSIVRKVVGSGLPLLRWPVAGHQRRQARRPELRTTLLGADGAVGVTLRPHGVGQSSNEHGTSSGDNSLSATVDRTGTKSDQYPNRPSAQEDESRFSASIKRPALGNVYRS